MAARYKSIMFSSAAITACRVSTSWPSGGRPASGSGPVNTSGDRQPAVPRSNGSAAAEASSMRRLGTMSDTRASYHVGLKGWARPIREMPKARIG
jgi:hypothetical protein